MFNTNDKGFTLVELLVTLAILSITISIIAFNVTIVFDNNLEAYASELCSDIRVTRFTTMSEGDSIKIKLFHDTINGYYGYKIEEGSTTLKTVNLDKKYTLIFMSQEIMFNTNGIPTAGSEDTIIIKDTSSGKSKTISIVPETGRVLLND